MNERIVLTGLIMLGVVATGLKLLRMYNATGSEFTRRNLRAVCMMLGWTTLAVLWTLDAYDTLPRTVHVLLILISGVLILAALLMTFWPKFAADRIRGNGNV